MTPDGAESVKADARTICARLKPSVPTAERTVSGWTPSTAAIVPTLKCSAKNNRRISARCSGVITAQPVRPKGSTHRTGAPHTTQTGPADQDDHETRSSKASAGGGGVPIVETMASGATSVDAS